MIHWLDRAFGAFLSRASLFSQGWGDEETLALLARPAPTDPGAPEAIEIAWEAPQVLAGVYRRCGSFTTPALDLLKERETQTARFELLAPRDRVDGDRLHGDLPLCLYLSSTGEEGFMRRRIFAMPLVNKGLAALILENPFYGRRRPIGQRAAMVRSVAEQFAMNRATVRESKALLEYFRDRGSRFFAVSGYSMGGFMAALTATRCNFPIAAIPCAAGLSPASVFVEGVLSRSVEWPVLSKELGEDAARARLAGMLHAVAEYMHRAPKPAVAIVVAAKHDGFVRASDVEALGRAWPHAELRWVEGGHVSGYLRHQPVMRRAIADAVDRLKDPAIFPEIGRSS